jgi:NAD(P)-dependent dehydrogenase (short-subunit alcohol dehydrogenase family)
MSSTQKDEESLSMRGNVVIVTGGGRGMGRAHCLDLAERGASVVVNDISSEHVRKVVSEISDRGESAVGSEDTVATQDGARAIVNLAERTFGRLDAVINNAGTMRNGYIEDQTPESLEAMLDVHVRGPFFVTQAAWPLLRRRGGRVVMVSSAGGLFACQAEANYAAAKAGIYGLGKALAFEGREHDIRVNMILPHANTTITDGQPLPDFAKFMKPGLREWLYPHRRIDAVTPLVTYLVSPKCRFSGQAFAVGCGRYARVFVGVSPGWVPSDGGDPSAEALAEHLDEIVALDGFAVPEDLYEEIELMARGIGWRE